MGPNCTQKADIFHQTHYYNFHRLLNFVFLQEGPPVIADNEAIHFLEVAGGSSPPYGAVLYSLGGYGLDYVVRFEFSTRMQPEY